ncbi:MAG TPA: hypothetical protein G4N94_08545 [Caldilineae bacterium]|nr:hypothetical protein [Caldilineae bacterium]
MPPKPTKLSWTLAILAILLALALLILAQSTHPIVPSEDAYITFRYARNLAEGHGLVWNPGEDPVEGSTEFLWVMLVAGGSKLGPGVETVAWGLNILFAVLGTILVGLAAFHLSRRQALVVLLAAGAFAVGPISYYVRAGFATTLFTLLIAIAFVCTLILAFSSRHERLRSTAFIVLPLSLLLLGLTRPEGVLYGVLTLSAILLLLDRPERIRLLKTTALFLILPGLVYFIWRWQYFGYFLPNTFYVKSTGGLLHLRDIWDIYGMFKFLAPLLLLIGLGLAGAKRQRGLRMLVLIAPALLFPWAYLLIDQLQNMGQRFQYPVYPVFLLAAAAALGVFRLDRPPKWSLAALKDNLAIYVGVLLALFALFVPIEKAFLLELLVLAIILLKVIERWASWDIDPTALRGVSLLVLAVFAAFSIQLSYRLAAGFYPTQFDDRQTIGAALEPYADRGYTVVASEAGWIPFFSRWRAIDPFGLNDEHITHEGLSFDYLDSVQPDIIMYHDVANPNPPRWADMVATLRDYAESRGFVLAAIIERKGPNDLHVYYVNPRNPDAEALIEVITGQDGAVYQVP